MVQSWNLLGLDGEQFDPIEDAPEGARDCAQDRQGHYIERMRSHFFSWLALMIAAVPAVAQDVPGYPQVAPACRRSCRGSKSRRSRNRRDAQQPSLQQQPRPTFQDRAIRCQHQAGAAGLNPADVASYTRACVNRAARRPHPEKHLQGEYSEASSLRSEPKASVSKDEFDWPHGSRRPRCGLPRQEGGLPQTRIELVQRGRAWAQLRIAEPVERRLHRVEARVQIVGVGLDERRPVTTWRFRPPPPAGSSSPPADHARRNHR